MPAENSPFMPVEQCDEIPSTSCTLDEALVVREPPARARGVWKVAVVATVTGLIAAAGTWWSQSDTLGNAVGEEATGLGAEWGMYGGIGCSNWASIEISRSQVADFAECTTKCKNTAGCTMFNWQQDACEPGWPVARGCLLFKESCTTERNECWQLNIKLEEAGTVVTQAVTMKTQATKDQAAAAVAAALAKQGIAPVTTTATQQRRLQGQGRSLQPGVVTFVITWTFTHPDPAKADFAYNFGVSMATSEEVQAAFTANALEALPEGSTLSITAVAEPTREQASTTDTPPAPGPAPPPPDTCLTQADVDATIQAFMEAVPSLAPTASDCTLAKEKATGIIATAYAYAVPDVTVQFKPTLTTYPNVYRPTAQGALSYFIGPCVCPGVVDVKSANASACSLADGLFPGDNGFAFSPSHDFKGWASVTKPGPAKGGQADTNFWYNLGGVFCHTPMAQGPLCFTPNTGGEPTCVDKTFGFVPNPDPNGALKALINTHDSSLQFIPA